MKYSRLDLLRNFIGSTKKALFDIFAAKFFDHMSITLIVQVLITVGLATPVLANQKLLNNPQEYWIAHIPQQGVGMFSVFSYIAGLLYHYDRSLCAGLEIDFAHTGLYFNPKKGPNWWNYYCEPIKLGNKKAARIRQFQVGDYDYYANFTPYQLSRNQIHEIIKKYIHILPHIKQKINDYVSNSFGDSFIISVHYRGTDKIRELPLVPYAKVINCINRYIVKNNLKEYKIFVASDEQSFIDTMYAAFGMKVVTYPAARSLNNQPLHLSGKNCYQQGEEALIESQVLSRGDVLIRTSSNLSLWSTYFNPRIQVIDLNSL